ncbi:hypothetical protein ACFQL0_00805 [Haloplanus litoreus]|uniref:hypothetical protein n=1 Tax=Haloplanus litoreus TaxID=767515 RepID=UPI00360720FB
MDHADERYLAAKRTVDDRALDRRVRDRLLDELPAAPGCWRRGVAPASPSRASWTGA